MQFIYKVTTVNKTQIQDKVLTTAVLTGVSIESQLTLSNLVDDTEYTIGDEIIITVKKNGGE